jgi:PAS domain S-box-containing protein
MNLIPYVITTAAGIGIGKYVAEGSSSAQGSKELRLKDKDLLRFLQENVDDFAAFLEDLEGNVVSWNAGAERFFGYAKEEILGRSDRHFFVEEDQANRVHEKERETALREGKAMDERWHKRKDGKRFFASGVMESIRDASGAPRGFIKIFRDITDRKEMEEKLRASELHFHQLVDAMPQIAFTATADGVLDYFNEKWFEYTGLSVEQTYGPNDAWTAALHPEERKDIPGWYALVQEGKSYEAEERFRDKDGNYRWFLRRALPVRDSKGQVIRWFGTATDIHEQKQTQSALANTKEQLRHYAENLETVVNDRTAQLNQSVESLEGILYHVAHDLRAPLRAMNGFTQILMSQCSASLGAEGADYGRRIFEAVSRMDTLIQDLLSYGRMARPEIQMVAMDLEQELRAILSILEVEFKTTGAEVEVQGPFPSVLGDANLLGEILMNLLTNGVKFVAPGVRPHLRVWSETRGQMVRVWVEDNGIGIAPEYQAKIFGMFERLHKYETYPGTGVGLAVVAKGMKRMHGNFGVESEPGQGSRFWIELKRA